MPDVLAERRQHVDLRAVTARMHRLRAYVEKADYAGYDPFDALNSPFLKWVSSPSKWMRIACTQFLRRCPVDLRRMLGIRKGHNPKGIGLFLWGYARLYAMERKPEYRERIAHLLDLLEASRSRGWSGYCWGYNFDWQNTKMWTPKYTPTIVNTAFIGHALLDTYRFCGIDRALDMAVQTKDFICSNLARHEEGDRLCFSYTPLDRTYVHNANLLGASLLIRLYRICEDRVLEELALASLRYGLYHQREDGAWYYGQFDLMRYVDSFHTGFNLQALQYFIRQGYGAYCRENYDRGLQYYIDHFFLPDGMAKYYDNRVFPVDIHSPCQAIVVLSDSLGDDTGLSERIVRWMFQHMWSHKGYFYFRKGRLYTNKICYMRWSQAWAFHALTSYLFNKRAAGATTLVEEASYANLD